MKKVVNNYYVHISAIEELKKIDGAIEILEKTKEKLPLEFNYKIIKFNIKTKAITYVESNDWDEEKEPSVGNAITFNEKSPNGKLIKEKGQIYHHKWCFVSDNYKGFNIEESKKRSKEWEKYITKEWSCRIGYRKYWKEFLKENNIER